MQVGPSEAMSTEDKNSHRDSELEAFRLNELAAIQDARILQLRCKIEKVLMELESEDDPVEESIGSMADWMLTQMRESVRSHSHDPRHQQRCADKTMASLSDDDDDEKQILQNEADTELDTEFRLLIERYSAQSRLKENDVKMASMNLAMFDQL